MFYSLHWLVHEGASGLPCRDGLPVLGSAAECIPASWLPLFVDWMRTEVHVYAFSVAANVLLSFFHFSDCQHFVDAYFFQPIHHAGSHRSGAERLLS